MAFKMNGFNPGQGTGMGDAHAAGSSTGHPNKLIGQVLKQGAKKLFTKGGKNVVRVADDVAATGGKATTTAKNTGKMNFEQFMKQPGATEAKWKKYSKLLAKGMTVDLAFNNVFGGSKYGTIGDIFGFGMKDDLSLIHI